MKKIKINLIIFNTIIFLLPIAQAQANEDLDVMSFLGVTTKPEKELQFLYLSETGTYIFAAIPSKRSFSAARFSVSTSLDGDVWSPPYELDNTEAGMPTNYLIISHFVNRENIGTGCIFISAADAERIVLNSKNGEHNGLYVRFHFRIAGIKATGIEFKTVPTDTLFLKIITNESGQKSSFWYRTEKRNFEGYNAKGVAPIIVNPSSETPENRTDVVRP